MEENRYRALLIGFAVAIGILLVRLLQIQVFDDSYKKDSANNSMRYDYVKPTRGVIYDRNGQLLVDNNITYEIMVRPREITSLDTLLLSQALDMPVEEIREKMNDFKRRRRQIGYQSVLFKDAVSAETYTRFSELSYKFPAFYGTASSTRRYPRNAGGNILGYISQVDAKYIERHPEYRSGDYAGRTGIEAAYESELCGERGYHIWLRDSRNRLLEPYDDGNSDKLASPGKDLTTTIDADLQRYGEILMRAKVGSVVAIEPKTGEILAMVSSPGIDTKYLPVDSLRKYYNKKIAKNPYKPMFNRTVQASYPPGSVFKLVNGLIGMQEGVLKPWMEYPCNGGYNYTSTRKLGCHAHRSPLNMTDAIMMSCNGYFCYVFKNILENRKYETRKEAFDKWREYVLSFGFGNKLGIDFPSELGGNIPTSDHYDKMYRKKHWGFTNVVSLSIGQGEIGATPLQIANLSATVANRGWYITPHIVKDSDTYKIDPKYKERHYTMVDTTLFPNVIRGMWKAVNTAPGDGGTATSAAVPGLDICGKTGTAQNPHGADNAVFLCFAPMNDPKIAVAVYLENAGFGGTWASPLASLMIEKYLRGEISEGRKDMEQRVKEANLMQFVKVRR